MTTKSAFSAVGLAHKVCLSAEAQGYTSELLNALAEHPNLFQQLLQVQRGQASFTLKELIIDCDADPYVPLGWEVFQHHKGGKFKFDAAQVLFYGENEKNRHMLNTKKLSTELAGRPVLNANVLDYLLANKHLIPEDWKGKAIFFWDTVYRSDRGGLCVRGLCWVDGWWSWKKYWLEGLQGK